jgi:hypothetical protein
MLKKFFSLLCMSFLVVGLIGCAEQNGAESAAETATEAANDAADAAAEAGNAAVEAGEAAVDAAADTLSGEGN